MVGCVHRGRGRDFAKNATWKGTGNFEDLRDRIENQGSAAGETSSL